MPASMGPAALSPDTSATAPMPAYQLVVAAWAVHVVFVACMYNVGVLLPPLREEWPDVPQRVLGLCGSFFQASFMGAGLLSGIVLPKLGGRKSAMCGGVLSCAGFALASIVPNPYLLYPCLFLVGISGNLFWISAMSMIPLHFPRTSNKMCGVAATGVGFGSFLFPAIWDRFESDGGWRAAFLVTAGICLATGFFCAACFAPPPQPTTPQGAAATPSPALSPTGANPPSIATNKVFMAFVFGFSLGTLGFPGSFTHLKSYAEEIGMGGKDIRLAYGIFGVTSIIGRCAGGMLGDRVGTMNVFSGGMGGLCLCNAGVAFSNGGISWTIFFAAMGFSSGPFFAVLSPIMADLVGKGGVAQAMGFLSFMSTPTFFTSAFLMGFIRDLTGAFRYACLFSATCYFIGFLAMLRVRRLKREVDLAAVTEVTTPTLA